MSNIIQKDGKIVISNELKCNCFTDEIIIEKGNITNVRNIEINNNIEICGKIVGKNDNNSFIESKILDLQGLIKTTIKLNLNNFYCTGTENSIIGKYNNNKGILTSFYEHDNGIIYEINITCIETPDINSLNWC